MNARARILVQSELSIDNFMAWLSSWQTMAAIALLIALFSTAIAVIYVKEQHRQLTHELQALQAKQSRLSIKREQLLLEESTWAAQSRIRTIAEGKLAMRSPEQVRRLTLPAIH